MPFEKGHPRYGGRVAGQPNKINLKIAELCATRGVNPFEVFIELLGVEHDPHIRLKAATELAQYIAPRLKHIEHSGEVTNPYMQKTVEELEVIILEKLK